MNDIWPILVFSSMLILSQLSPGPDQTLVVRTSLTYGMKAGLIVTLGISFGIIAHAILAVTIGSLLFQGTWKMVFLCLASAWLIYLAWKIWPKKSSMNQGGDVITYTREPSQGELFRDALLCNLLNPKCTLFLITLSADLLNKNTGFLFSLFFIALVFVVGGLSWSIWVVVFQSKPVRKLYTSHMVLIDRVFSIALLLFALFLPFS